MLCDPIDGSPPGSPVPGSLQARVLEWGAQVNFLQTPTSQIEGLNFQYAFYSFLENDSKRHKTLLEAVLNSGKADKGEKKDNTLK